MGAHLPFWPLWLSDWGLSESEIGLFLGLAIGVRIAAGVSAPWLADLTGARRTALALLGALGAAAFLAHLDVATKPALFALTLLSAVALAGAVPISDALGAAAAERFGFAYAHARALGSAAFLTANLAVGGLAGWLGVWVVPWWIILSLAAMAALSLRHPGGAKREGPRPRIAEAAALARARPLLLAAAASACLQASHAPLYAYGSLYWRAQGIGEGAVGALWAAGVAAEVALMLAVGGWIGARLGPWRSFALAGLAGLVRWGVMAGDPSREALWALQLLHALTFAPAHLGMIAFIQAAAPPRLAASAQGLVGAGAGGAAMALATLGAAALYPAAGGGVFWFSGALSAAGLAAALALRRSWDGARLAVETQRGAAR